MAFGVHRCYVAVMGEMDETGPLELRARYRGTWAPGDLAPRPSAVRGARGATPIALDVSVQVADVRACIADPDHRVRVRGRLEIAGVLPATSVTGEARLYVDDPEVGMKRCEYRLAADPGGRHGVHVEGATFVRPGRATHAERGTLYVRIRTDDDTGASTGAAVLRDRWRDRWSWRGRRSPAEARWRRFVADEIAAPMAPVPS